MQTEIVHLPRLVPRRSAPPGDLVETVETVLTVRVLVPA
jgi:hypothetical protein